MGLSDRDYMHDKRRSRPFRPPPERFSLGALGIVLFFVAGLFFLYQIADWQLSQRPASATHQPAAEPSIARSPPAGQTLRPPRPANPSAPRIADIPAGASTVIKCIVNGTTSYSDSPCPPGAISSHVTTRSDHNLMDAFRPPTAPFTEQEAPAAPTTAATPTYSVPAAAANPTECQALTVQIERWDAMARQPQSAQTQDWISAQRKQARDRQFRLHCP